MMAILGSTGQGFGFLFLLGLVISGASPRARGAMEPAIDRHGPPYRALTWGRLVALLLKQAIQAKPTGPGILALQVQDVFEKRQAELITRVWEWTSSLILQTGKAIF